MWADEKRLGQEDGRKDRPAVIVLTVEVEDGESRVVVVPITHSRPAAQDDSLEIPAAIKRHLNLDEQPSWVVVSEINVFIWPGPDVRPVPNSTTVVYGLLPAGFFRQIRDRLVANIRQGKSRQVPRTS
ncbi:MAG: type II toxin-antitoxin system PemK/MazF family toxin [Hyphomicrobiaceae bacterium]|nr:type II toxin-antitoxin system PemK/MazF family toxin [Hyphomicrobiaceae bacterium]